MRMIQLAICAFGPALLVLSLFSVFGRSFQPSCFSCFSGYPLTSPLDDLPLIWSDGEGVVTCDLTCLIALIIDVTLLILS